MEINNLFDRDTNIAQKPSAPNVEELEQEEPIFSLSRRNFLGFFAAVGTSLVAPEVGAVPPTLEELGSAREKAIKEATEYVAKEFSRITVMIEEGRELGRSLADARNLSAEDRAEFEKKTEQFLNKKLDAVRNNAMNAINNANYNYSKRMTKYYPAHSPLRIINPVKKATLISSIIAALWNGDVEGAMNNLKESLIADLESLMSPAY